MPPRSSPAGATISRGRRTASSSARACRPAGPTYSAAVNSPVDRSSNATPTTGRGSGGRRPRRARQLSEERGLARVEVVALGQRAGRHDAHDLAPDDALGLAGILDLIADRDAEALLDQPRQVGVDGVVRHAAHRDRRRPAVLRSRRQRETRARAPPPARPRRTSRRSRPCGRTGSRRDTAASRRGTGAWPV